MRASGPAASFAVVVAVVGLLAPSSASADPAAAEALFREGRRLLDQGRVDEACVKLAESQVQDPSSGTLLNLGLCHEIQRKLATAWSDYVSAARLAREQGRPDRVAVADKKAAELEPRLPHLTVMATVPVAGLQISRGSERMGPGSLGSSVPVDPGSYVVKASAPGRQGWQMTIDIGEAESKTVQVPELQPEAPDQQPSSPPAPAAAPVAAVTALAPAPASPPPSGGRMLGWIIGGAGVAALGVGTGFGVASLLSYNDASKSCPLRTGCSAAAISARNSAETKAWITNVAVGLGVVGVAAGGWILLTGRRAGPATRVAVQATPDAEGMRVALLQSF